MEIELRKFEENDMPVFIEWLNTPHVKEWYHDTEEWIKELEKRNSEYSWVRHYMALSDGKPIGFCQYYDYSLGGETWHKNASVDGAFSIDYLVGETDYLKKGCGSKICALITGEVRKNENATKVIVQPEPENAASRGVLRSCGYEYDEENDIFVLNMTKQG